METTHTPAPWEVKPSSNPENGTGWRDIVSMGGAYPGSYVGEALEQDASLMAAAPDIYEALKALQKELRAHVKFDVKKHFSLMTADVQASKAIEKAEGR